MLCHQAAAPPYLLSLSLPLSLPRSLFLFCLSLSQPLSPPAFHPAGPAACASPGARQPRSGGAAQQGRPHVRDPAHGNQGRRGGGFPVCAYVDASRLMRGNAARVSDFIRATLPEALHRVLDKHCFSRTRVVPIPDIDDIHPLPHLGVTVHPPPAAPSAQKPAQGVYCRAYVTAAGGVPSHQAIQFLGQVRARAPGEKEFRRPALHGLVLPELPQLVELDKRRRGIIVLRAVPRPATAAAWRCLGHSHQGTVAQGVSGQGHCSHGLLGARGAARGTATRARGATARGTATRGRWRQRPPIVARQQFAEPIAIIVVDRRLMIDGRASWPGPIIDGNACSFGRRHSSSNGALI